MARLDIDLSPFNAAREGLAGLAGEQRALDAEIGALQRELASAQRAGAESAAALERRVADALQSRQALVDRQRALKRDFDALADRAALGLDPSRLVESLDGRQPIALLPVRIETRYLTRNDRRTLGIRIYPDDLHTIDHEPTPTANELQAAQAYWRARFRRDDADAARLLRDLTAAQGRGRANWLVRVLTPTNALPAEGQPPEPEFPATETIQAQARKTRAVLLPERFCAVGYAAGRREVFRVWGRTVPDELVLAPDWQLSDKPEALLGGERAWMVDFDAALANGMAIEVTQQHIVPPFDLAGGTMERLLVIGFEWTKSAADAGADFTSLLAAHRDSTGLGFAALGTPTNNTEARPAGYSKAQQALPAAPTGLGPEDQDALQLLTWAFGIAPVALADEHIENAHLTDQRTALHMMNLLWRGTFGEYLLQMWNPMDEDFKSLLDTPTLYALRRYAAAYVRPTGALPVLRVRHQPYGLLPLVGRRFHSAGDLAVETALGKVLGVLRPMWEIASGLVPQLVDGDVDKAKDILQTAAWSQAAYYRDKDVSFCRAPSPFSDAQTNARSHVVQSVLSSLGPWKDWQVHIGVCNDFLPDGPYKPGYLAGVPWVLADAQEPTKEAADGSTFGAGNNYLDAIAAAAVQIPQAARAVLEAAQNGPALLQALSAYSVQKEQGDAADGFLVSSGALQSVTSRALTVMPHVEKLPENEAFFTVHTPKELAALQIPALTGRATLGEHVAHATVAQLPALAAAPAHTAASRFFDDLGVMSSHTRNLGAVKQSLDFLSTRTIGELNIAFRSTLDAFSYRLDAWITARANRRLEQMRAAQPQGLNIGAYAWVENLKADTRPDSGGFLLAPSQGQAAAAALLRSGFMANQEHGAFDIALDSKRTRRAEGILQGLTRDQPLAALYGYRIERALRDSQRGRLIWPLRLAYPWRPLTQAPSEDATESVGARDVVDGVALLEAWQGGQGNVVTGLNTQLAKLVPPGAALAADDVARLRDALDDALDLADSVSDLLLAEGAYQIAQGNPARAAAAMAVADKQSLPIETQVGKTPRGGASYTQRVVAICSGAAAGWPVDRRALAEPALNAWLASLLGDPAPYVFTATVHRVAPDGKDVVDLNPVTVGVAALGLSPLSLVLLVHGEAAPRQSGRAETGLRGAAAAALFAAVPDNTAGVAALEITPETAGQIGFGPFEAFAATLKALVDKSRFATRKDLVRIDNEIEAGLPKLGEYAGVDVDEIVQRADDSVGKFDADALLTALDGMADLLPPTTWPAQVFAIEAPGADPARREERAAAAVQALTPVVEALQAALQAAPPLLKDQAAPTPQQQAQHAVSRLKLLFGKDFPVLPRFALGPYAAEFNASLADQVALALGDPWRVNGWLTQVARVREGADRFAAALSAHEALREPLAAGDLLVVQFPHCAKQVWAALPEAWREAEGTPFDPKQVPEELQDYLAQRPDAPYRDIQRVAPNLAITLYAPGLAALGADETMAAFVCDDWPEFIPDPFQTAAIGFHYDAPGARPPQTVLLALPPQAQQAAWSFDDAVDVIHEAFDLARLRAVRPCDLGGGLGAILPGNYLPQNYTDELPSVRLLELRREALKKLMQDEVRATSAFPLGKI
jgi:hypothetical protein